MTAPRDTTRTVLERLAVQMDRQRRRAEHLAADTNELEAATAEGQIAAFRVAAGLVYSELATLDLTEDEKVNG